MSYNISSLSRKGKKLLFIVMVVIVMFLSSIVITACEGNCNGVGNCSCNGNGSANCNGGSVPFNQQVGQQAHGAESGGSGLASTQSGVSVQLDHFRAFWIHATSHNDHVSGLGFQRYNN